MFSMMDGRVIYQIYIFLVPSTLVLTICRLTVGVFIRAYYIT